MQRSLDAGDAYNLHNGLDAEDVELVNKATLRILAGLDRRRGAEVICFRAE